MFFHRAPVVVAIVGASGSGKTTLIERTLPLFAARRWRVAVMKHTHHAVAFDKPGKDSWRCAQSGADQVALMTPSGVARFDYQPPTEPPEAVAARLFPDVDLILIEGCKWRPVPKIEVFRRAVASEPICANDPRLLAIATNDELVGTRVLPLDDPRAVADFVIEQMSRGGASEAAGS